MADLLWRLALRGPPNAAPEIPCLTVNTLSLHLDGTGFVKMRWLSPASSRPTDVLFATETTDPQPRLALIGWVIVVFLRLASPEASDGIHLDLRWRAEDGFSPLDAPELLLLARLLKISRATQSVQVSETDQPQHPDPHLVLGWELADPHLALCALLRNHLGMNAIDVGNLAQTRKRARPVSWAATDSVSGTAAALAPVRRQPSIIPFVPLPVLQAIPSPAPLVAARSPSAELRDAFAYSPASVPAQELPKKRRLVIERQ